jgi:hypothetical protein
MSNFVVYTAITDGYDPLRSPPEKWRAQADFVAFLGEGPAAPGWEVRPIYRRFRDPCRNAKIHKVLPHRFFPDAEYSLWIDGSIVIQSPLSLKRLAQIYLRHHDLAVFKHPVRQCIFQEGLYCMKQQLDLPEVIDRQLQKYFEEGYPLNNGLAECTILLRRHTPRMRRFNEAWYAEIQAHSRRDQLSFNYVAHKLGLEYSLLPGRVSKNPHFARLRHTGIRSNPDAL